jgi:hypothetical protein
VEEASQGGFARAGVAKDGGQALAGIDHVAGFLQSNGMDRRQEEVARVRCRGEGFFFQFEIAKIRRFHICKCCHLSNSVVKFPS